MSGGRPAEKHSVKSLSRSQIKNNYFLSRILNQGRGRVRWCKKSAAAAATAAAGPPAIIPRADEILVNELLASSYRCSQWSICSSPGTVCRFIASSSQPFFPKFFRRERKQGRGDGRLLPRPQGSLETPFISPRIIEKTRGRSILCRRGCA